jgi:hypothetical protein
MRRPFAGRRRKSVQSLSLAGTALLGPATLAPDARAPAVHLHRHSRRVYALTERGDTAGQVSRERQHAASRPAELFALSFWR